MKKLSAVAIAATVMAGNVFAGDQSIKVIARGGWKHMNNDVQKTGTPNSSAFNFDYLRTKFSGDLTPSVKYVLTTNLLKANETNDTNEGISKMIFEGYVTKTFSFGTQMSFGRKKTIIGGREYDYLSSDLYSTSYFYNATPSPYAMGITLAHEMAGQTFRAQYINGNKTTTTGVSTTGTATQSKFGYALEWNGNLMDGMIKPIVSYTVIPEIAGSSTTKTARVNKGNDAFLGAGLQFNLPQGMVLEADYNMLTEKDATGTTAAAKDLKTESIVVHAKMNGETFSPFVKFIADTRKNDSTKTDSRTAYDLGFEYKEAKEDAIRYHVVYSGSSVKANINTTEVKSSPSSIMVGMKFTASLLK